MAESLLICAAVADELTGVRDALTSGRSETIGGRRTVAGRVQTIPTRLLITGPGTFNAVQALTAVLEKRPPRIILMIGCAGVFGRCGLTVGDIGVAAEEIDAHLGIEGETPDAPPSPLPFPVLTTDENEIRGRYPLGFLVEAAARRLARRFRAEGVNVAAGPFLTVSTVTASDRRADRLFDAFAPVMENMEGAGAAHVAALYNIPFLEVRCAANRVGNRDRTAWQLDAAFDRCARAALALTDLFKETLTP